MGKSTYIMTWKGFRLGGTVDHDSHPQLQQSLSPAGPFPVRHSEQIPRSTSPMGQLIPRFSESTANSPLAGESQVAERSPPVVDPPAVSRRKSDHNAKQQTTLRNKFSLMRFRHASDPQLSASYNQAGTPPVPSLPPRKSIPPPLFLIHKRLNQNIFVDCCCFSIFKRLQSSLHHLRLATRNLLQNGRTGSN